MGFFGRAGSTPGRGVGRTASGGIGPTKHSLDRGVPRLRLERDLGRRRVAARPAPTASHHLPRGGMGGTCDPQPKGAQARSHARSSIAGPPRGPAPSRRSITGHGVQKAGAHHARILLRGGQNCWWARQHATSVPTSLLRGKRLPDHMLGAACRRQRALVVLGFATPSRGVLAELRGQKQRGRIAGVGASRGADWGPC